MEKIITSAKAAIAEIERRLQQHANVINGTPWVIELAAGLYMVADGDGYRGGSITGRVVSYSIERVTVAVHQVRKEHGEVFGGARHVHIVDALKAELASMQDILARAEKLSAAAEA